MPARLDTAQFIARAKAIHGDKYDYSKVVYIDMKTKVTIICPEHGEFEQSPNSHIHGGSGCWPCELNRRSKLYSSTTKEFIVKAEAKHGDTYDYSKVDYKNNETKVIIICRKHGEFLQSPAAHLVGGGCSLCGDERVSKIHRSNTKEFIAKAKAIHGDKYDYTKVDYMNNYTKVIIICSLHGEFEQVPQYHLDGCGCPDCKGLRISEKLSSNTKEFITKVKEVHGDKYDYSKVDYKNNYTKIIIICRKCKREFLQRPQNHLSGVGCPGCAESGFDQLKPACVYQIRFVTQDHGLFYKCGISNNKPEIRRTQIRTSYKNAYTTPKEVTIVDVVNFDLGSAALNFENKLKASEHRLNNGHFIRPFTGSTETYNTGVLAYWDELKAEVAEDRRV